MNSVENMRRWQSGNAGDPTSPVSVGEAQVANVRRFESCPSLSAVIFSFSVGFLALFKGGHGGILSPYSQFSFGSRL